MEWLDYEVYRFAQTITPEATQCWEIELKSDQGPEKYHRNTWGRYREDEIVGGQEEQEEQIQYTSHATKVAAHLGRENIDGISRGEALIRSEQILQVLP